MYTELIFGCKLSKSTPKVCLDALNHVINGKEDDTVSEEVQSFITKYSLDYLCWCSSYYFGVCESISKMWYDSISNSWRISIRSSIKNYNNEIERFLDYIKNYVERGSGDREIYAYVTYEKAEFPTIYALTGVYNMPEIKDEE